MCEIKLHEKSLTGIGCGFVCLLIDDLFFEIDQMGLSEVTYTEGMRVKKDFQG